MYILRALGYAYLAGACWTLGVDLSTIAVRGKLWGSWRATARGIAGRAVLWPLVSLAIIVVWRLKQICLCGHERAYHGHGWRGCRVPDCAFCAGFTRDKSPRTNPLAQL